MCRWKLLRSRSNIANCAPISSTSPKPSKQRQKICWNGNPGRFIAKYALAKMISCLDASPSVVGTKWWSVSATWKKMTQIEWRWFGKNKWTWAVEQTFNELSRFSHLAFSIGRLFHSSVNWRYRVIKPWSPVVDMFERLSQTLKKGKSNGWKDEILFAVPPIPSQWFSPRTVLLLYSRFFRAKLRIQLAAFFNKKQDFTLANPKILNQKKNLIIVESLAQWNFHNWAHLSNG